ncbi:MAG: CoA-transferase family III [Rhodobacteraceae bacterium HLUCCA12]|nr:MAG: CoA-transferase family III [Rhodobacteraceae bacterium HLUCCA12]
MNRFLLGLSVSIVSTLAMAGPMAAQSHSGHWFWRWLRGGSGGDTGGSPSNPASVPEIDASAGLLALAAVAAAMLFVWERRRRAG